MDLGFRQKSLVPLNSPTNSSKEGSVKAPNSAYPPYLLNGGVCYMYIFAKQQLMHQQQYQQQQLEAGTHRSVQKVAKQ
jgi:hypothetical protein